jgi:hypothetical protein
MFINGPTAAQFEEQDSTERKRMCSVLGLRAVSMPGLVIKGFTMNRLYNVELICGRFLRRIGGEVTLLFFCLIQGLVQH